MNRTSWGRAVAFGLCMGPVATAQIYPEPGLQDNSTGLVTCQIGNSFFRGSGVIARDQRLVFSCAHVIYDNGTWSSNYRFHRAYHSDSAPFRGDGVEPRGYRYFTNYTNNLQQYGQNSSEAYALDFVVYYADQSFGDAVGYWFDGGNVMRSDRWKRIIGYPSEIEYTGRDGEYFQHATDWFQNQGSQRSGSYHTFSGVSTGPGNSGGPLFVYDSADDTEYLAGILVSGTDSTAGVCGLNDDTRKMASNALGIQSTTRTFSNTSKLRLPAKTRKFKRRKIVVSGFSEGIETIVVNGMIRTKRRGDLDIYLRSPEGRIQWLQKASKNRRRNVRFRNLDLTSTYAGASANGTWELRIKDRKKKNRATFREFSITITAPATP